MDASALVKKYIDIGCRFQNGNVINRNGKVIDHLTREALEGIDANTKVAHDLARRTTQTRLHRGNRIEPVNNKGAFANPAEKDET